MEKFKEKVLKTVGKIRKGEFLTYKETARLSGNEKAQRAIGNILSKNRNPEIPCHRVIRNDGIIGSYYGQKNLAWQKLALLLRDEAVAVMPTDTIYGICASAFSKTAIQKIYKLRKRNSGKPMIILISDFNDLKTLGIKPSVTEMKILKKIWPGKTSVILKCPSEKFKYLHRGTKTLAVRMPKNNFLKRVIKISGPIVAPSANWEGKKPAGTITEARKYFKDKVVYYNAGKISGKPSSLIKIKNGNIEFLRK